MLEISPELFRYPSLPVVLSFPGDKSISHRALICAGLAEGTSHLGNLSSGQDVNRTKVILQNLGVSITQEGQETQIEGMEAKGFVSPGCELECGNSGTTARLMLGVLASEAEGFYTLKGDRSLCRRPMGRVMDPLERMGATFLSLDSVGHLPLEIKGRELQGIDYALPVPSAQVKSALLLAGIRSEGTTRVYEEIPTRDHTERLLQAMGAEIEVSSQGSIVVRKSRLQALSYTIPGDFSSAAYFLALSILLPNVDLKLQGVGLNPYRCGFLSALEKMGLCFEITNREETKSREPLGDLSIKKSQLKGIRLRKEDIPGIIDELPLLAVVATQAQGETRIEGALELRIKESDRISAICKELRKLGADIKEFEDGFSIQGPTALSGSSSLESHGDHRIALALIVASSIASGSSLLQGEEWVAVSYPGFLSQIREILGKEAFNIV